MSVIKVLENKRGLALIMVLWVVALLSVIALEFSYTMRTEVDIWSNYKDEIKSYFIARAGIERAIIELQRMKAVNVTSTEVKEDTVEVKEDAVWRTDGTPHEIAFHEGNFKVIIEDEAGKLDINKSTEDDLGSLLVGLGVPAEDIDIIVDSIMDWRDKDDLHHLNGAEKEYYEALPEPYTCKNGDFDTIEELLLVRGMTRELYEKLKGKITVYSTGRINFNAASPELLKVVIKDDVLVSHLMEMRNKQPLSQEELNAALAGHATKLPLGTTGSGFYTVKSSGQVNNSGTVRSIKAVIHMEGAEIRFVNWKDRYWEVPGDRI